MKEKQITFTVMTDAPNKEINKLSNWSGTRKLITTGKSYSLIVKNVKVKEGK